MFLEVLDYVPLYNSQWRLVHIIDTGFVIASDPR